MPTLPTYTAQIGQPGTPGGRGAAPSDFYQRGPEGLGEQFAQGAVNRAARHAGSDPFGRQLELFGETLTDIGEQVLARREEDDKRNLIVQASRARAEAYKQMQALAEEGAADIDEQMADFVQTQSQSLRDAAETRAGLAYAEKAAADLDVDVGYSARATGARIRGQQAEQDTKDMVQYWSDVMQDEPEMFPRAVDYFDTFFNHLDVPDAARRELQRNAHNDLAVIAARRWIDYDADLGRRMVESEKFDQYLRPGVKKDLLDFAESAKKAKEREARIAEAEARQQSDDANTRLFTNIATDIHAVDTDGDGLADGTGRPLKSMEELAIEINNLASKTDALGLPLLDAQQVRTLHNDLLRKAQGIDPEDDPEVVRRLQLSYLGQSDEQFSSALVARALPDLSPSSRERWLNRATENRQYLREQSKYVGAAVNDVLSRNHFTPQWLEFTGNTLVVEEMTTALENAAEELANDGKSPLSYLSNPAWVGDIVEPYVNKIRNGPSLEDARAELEARPLGYVVQDTNDPNTFAQIVRRPTGGRQLTQEDTRIVTIPEDIPDDERAAYIEEQTGVAPVFDVTPIEVSPESSPGFSTQENLSKDRWGPTILFPLGLPGPSLGELADMIFGTGEEPDEEPDEEPAND